jgi:hypothetical protein
LLSSNFWCYNTSVINCNSNWSHKHGKNREIILIKDGHDDITFFELSEPMTKPQAVTFLVERKEDFESLADRCAIDEANDKYNTVVTKGTRNSIAKPNLDEIKERAADAVAEEA